MKLPHLDLHLNEKADAAWGFIFIIILSPTPCGETLGF